MGAGAQRTNSQQPAEDTYERQAKREDLAISQPRSPEQQGYPQPPSYVNLTVT